MAKFRVKYRSINYMYLDVEAIHSRKRKRLQNTQTADRSSKMGLVIGNMITQKMKMEM